MLLTLGSTKINLLISNNLDCYSLNYDASIDLLIICLSSFYEKEQSTHPHFSLERGQVPPFINTPPPPPPYHHIHHHHHHHHHQIWSNLKKLKKFLHAKLYPNKVFVLMLFMIPYSRLWSCPCTLMVLQQEASVLLGRTTNS